MKFAQLLLFLSVIFIDRFLKLQILQSTPDTQVNSGIAFSLFQGNNNLIILLNLLVVGYVGYLLFKINKTQDLTKIKRLKFIEIFSLVLILAGGTSNIIDRINYGGVVDYISVGSFPKFNLADVAITSAIVIYVLIRILFDLKIFEKLAMLKLKAHKTKAA
ncbi:MAG TPA: signal peptidase II [Candidatus Dojkabacteria bacterium]|nr:signal peptidase II [Candidatus Dojkabacteria bacterium]